MGTGFAVVTRFYLSQLLLKRDHVFIAKASIFAEKNEEYSDDVYLINFETDKLPEGNNGQYFIVQNTDGTLTFKKDTDT